MHIRPRCREWLPLSSQQLRLRNLVRVQGFNIDCASSNSLIYYTLHHTQQSEEFYRSEALPARHPHQKWAEIACMEMLQSNLNCVCIKVWEKFGALELNKNKLTNMKLDHLKLKRELALKTPKSLSVTKENSSKQYFTHCDPPHRPPDKLIFVWGVYFSGLIPTSAEVEPIQCLQNSLIFQLHADYFASAEHLKPDTLRQQLEINYKQFHAGSPKVGGTVPPDEFSINSPKVSRSSSPVHCDTDLKDKTNRDLLTMSKARSIDLCCARSEVRRSYDLKKLLDIQELQRLQVQKYNKILEISAEVKQRCVRCITTEQLICGKHSAAAASSVLHHYPHTSMGRTLSLLLSDQQQRCDPETLLRMQTLQEQIESTRSRQRLLHSEYDTYTDQIIQLRGRLSALSDSRQQLQASLQKRRTQLDADRKQLEDGRRRMQQLVQTKAKAVQDVERCMTSLCIELRGIYPVDSICGVPFFHMDEYLRDARYSAAQVANITPLALSASLGYLAHLVHVIAIIFNRPLRNPIRHEGSRSRIIDLVQDLPLTAREYPLYSRSIILAKPVKYAIHLLDQNVAQLCYDFAGVRRDLRGTIENILTFFAALSAGEQNQRDDSIQQRITDSLSNSHSSVDLNNVPAPNLSPMAPLLPSSRPMVVIAERHLPQQRICRSVGSYSDCEDDFKDIIDHCYSNSESNITNRKYAK